MKTIFPIALATVLALPLGGCEGGAQAQSGQPAASSAPKVPQATATRVEVATIQPSKASLRLTVPGEVQGVRDALLAAPLGGYVESVRVTEGSRVRQGQALVSVDSATHVARREQAQVQLETAERELRRLQAAADAVPRAQLEAAEAQRDMARAALRTAQIQATRSVIRAPFDGVIVKVDIEVGEVAAPGVPLLRLVQLDPAKVTVSLSDRDVMALREGMPARVQTDARSGVFEGQVAHIHRAADLETRAFAADITVQNPDEKLLPGMIASVTLDAAGAGGQLVISQDWLVTRIDEVGVFVSEGRVARWRTVELGAVARKRVVVESGLKPGDQIVIAGHRELAEGDPLLIARQGVCCRDGRVTFPEASQDEDGPGS